MAALTHPIVIAIAAQVRAAIPSTLPTEPEATAVMVSFISKLRNVWPIQDEPVQAHASEGDVPLEELVTSGSLGYWKEVLDDADSRAEWVRRLRHLWCSSTPVYPQADGSVVLPLNWIHPDQEVPDAGLVTPLDVTLQTRSAYLFPNEDGEWRFDHFALPVTDYLT